jgi:hypothetical protein
MAGQSVTQPASTATILLSMFIIRYGCFENEPAGSLEGSAAIGRSRVASAKERPVSVRQHGYVDRHVPLDPEVTENRYSRVSH